MLQPSQCIRHRHHDFLRLANIRHLALPVSLGHHSLIGTWLYSSTRTTVARPLSQSAGERQRLRYLECMHDRHTWRLKAEVSSATCITTARFRLADVCSADGAIIGVGLQFPTAATFKRRSLPASVTDDCAWLDVECTVTHAAAIPPVFGFKGQHISEYDGLTP
jgi:hypothetical protein